MTLIQTSDPTRIIPARRVSFADTFADMPKYFAIDGDPFNSHLVASMSSVFPDGEDFFVRSVRHYRDQITDPVLQRQVNGFIGQEATHGREHRALNNRLAELGYRTKGLERLTKRALSTREKVAPPIANLASTAALEHFTATLAEHLLTSSAARDTFAQPEVLNLLLWHALEESEHKAVAFDVYRAVGGSERLRVWTMRFTRFGLIAALSALTLFGMLTDREVYRHGNLRRAYRHFRHAPLLDKRLWIKLKAYERPDFHPDDFETSALEAEWRRILFPESETA